DVEQSVSQPAVQLPSQSKPPGFTSQLASQSTSQPPVQSTLADAEHWPSQAAVKFSGVQSASHPPSTSTLHLPSATAWKLLQASPAAKAFDDSSMSGAASTPRKM